MRTPSRIASAVEEARWVASFVEDSDKGRDVYKDIWQETYQNYLVRPWSEGSFGTQVQYPYLTAGDTRGAGSGYATLKDPESHQIVESVNGAIIQILLSDPNFLIARPVGGEDVGKGVVASKLVRYVMRLEGHYRSMVEWLKGGLIFGTSLMEGYWDYREEDGVFRQVSADYGVEDAPEVEGPMVAYDDYRMMPLALMDFFPDAGANRIYLMHGMAKRFTMTAAEARRKAAIPKESGGYDREAVETAIENHKEDDARERQDRAWVEGLDRPVRQKSHKDLGPLVGYCYYGDVPYRPADGKRRRRVEVLSGELVRSEAFFGRYPFFDYTPVPVEGRFYGVAPLEVIRYDQDFADCLKMLIADAAARATHPPFEVDRNSGIDRAKLRAFRTEVPILSNRIGSIMQIPYNPPIGPAVQAYSSLKQQMREGSGGLGVIQGLGLGVNRASATEAAGTIQRAQGRPEAMAMLIEREYLPPMGQHILENYRRYSTSDDIALRIGEQFGAVGLADILPSFDLEFVGSRIEGGKAERRAGYRELFTLGANQYVAPMVPWPEVLARYLKEFGLDEIAALVGSQVLEQTLLAALQQQGAIGGNGNGTTPALPPAGLAPAQLTGEAAGG